MLVDVCFPIGVRYLPPRGRVIRHETLLSRTTIRVRELGITDAPRAYVLTPAPTTVVLDGTILREADLIELISFEGDVWWPLRNISDTADVTIDEWATELSKPRGNHTISPHRGGKRIPDVLGLRKLLGPLRRSQEWPDAFAHDVCSRRTLENTHDQAVCSLHRAADDVLIRNGRLFVRAGEPIWLLNAPIRHFQGGRIPLDLSPVPSTRALESISASFDPPAAFMDYELFRLDRKHDADLCRSERLERDQGSVERQFAAGSDRYAVEIFEAPPLATQPLVPMLKELGEAFMRMITGMVATVRSSLPPVLHELTAQVIMTEYGPSYLKRLVGLAAPAPTASAVDMLLFLEDVTSRLEGIDPSKEMWGYLETMMMSVERARRRTTAELADGSRGFSTEDFSLLSALAG